MIWIRGEMARRAKPAEMTLMTIPQRQLARFKDARDEIRESMGTNWEFWPNRAHEREF